VPLVLGKSDTYSWKIELRVPVDNGKYEKQNFYCVFKRIEQSKIEAYQKKLMNTKMDVMFEAARKFAKEVVVGWKDILDANEDQIPFTDEAFDQLLEKPLIGIEIAKTYIDSVTGEKTKN